MTSVERTIKRSNVLVTSKSTRIVPFHHYLNFNYGKYPGRFKGIQANGADVPLAAYHDADIDQLKVFSYSPTPAFTKDAKTGILGEQYILPKDYNNTIPGDGESVLKIDKGITGTMKAEFSLVNYRSDIKTDTIWIGWAACMDDQLLVDAILRYKYCRFHRIKLTVTSLDEVVIPLYATVNKGTLITQCQDQVIATVTPMRQRTTIDGNKNLKQRNSHFRIAPKEPIDRLWNYTYENQAFILMKEDDLVPFREKVPYSARKLTVIDDRYHTMDGGFQEGIADGYISYGHGRPSTYSTEIKYSYSPNHWFTTEYACEQISLDAPINHAEYFKESVYPDPCIQILTEDNADVFRTAIDIETKFVDEIVRTRHCDVPTGLEKTDLTRPLAHSEEVHAVVIPEVIDDETDPEILKRNFEKLMNGRANNSIHFQHNYRVEIELEMNFIVPQSVSLEYTDLFTPVTNTPLTTSRKPDGAPIAQPIRVPTILKLLFRFASLVVSIYHLDNLTTVRQKDYSMYRDWF